MRRPAATLAVAVLGLFGLGAGPPLPGPASAHLPTTAAVASATYAAVPSAIAAVPSAPHAAVAAVPAVASPAALAAVAATPAGAATSAPPPGAAPTALPTGGSCLPVRRADLVKLIAAQPLAKGDGDGKFVSVSRGSPRWLAGFNLALAWENDDCPALADFAAQMGYTATEIIDEPTGEHHYVLLDKAGRHNGLVVLRAPAERAAARQLTITAPHVGFDFRDDRAIRLYRQVKAVAYLQNTAERCSSPVCSGCTATPAYACGGCPRASDAAHSVDHLLLAVYAGLEAVHKDLRFEYHGAARSAGPPGCRGSAHLSQGSTLTLSPAQDDGSYPSRFWKALEQRLGPQCVCYHQRERGCLLPGTASVFGRLTNEEPTTPFDPCGQPAVRLSGRFLHLEGAQLPVEDITAALSAAVPLRGPG